MIRESLLQSDRFLELPDNTARICYIAALLKADDLGNLEATDGQLVRLWRDFGIETRDRALKVIQMLVDVDLLRVYEAEEKRHIHIPRFNQRVRHIVRRCTGSPWDDEKKINNLVVKTSDGRQTNDGRTPDARRLKRREVKRSEEKKPLSGKPDVTNPEVWNFKIDPDPGDEAHYLLAFLNKVTKSKYRAVDANLRIIRGRLVDFTVAEMKAAIVHKAEQWEADAKMAEYLRPATLFAATNMAQYVEAARKAYEQ